MREAGGEGRSVGEASCRVARQARRSAEELRDVVQTTLKRHHQPAAKTQEARATQKT